MSSLLGSWVGKEEKKIQGRQKANKKVKIEKKRRKKRRKAKAKAKAKIIVLTFHSNTSHANRGGFAENLDFLQKDCLDAVGGKAPDFTLKGTAEWSKRGWEKRERIEKGRKKEKRKKKKKRRENHFG